jgi:transglutaminase-like putative cysteine protease
VPRDLFGGARRIDELENLDASDRVQVRGSSSTCTVEALLERIAPERDEPLAPGPKLEVDAGTRWRTAIALAKFVDQAVQPAAASAADEEPKQVLAAHRGSCLGQARVFAMLAGARLPTRVVYGVLVEDGRAAAHAWNEVQVNGRWYGVDPSRGLAPVGPEHIPLAREGDADPLRAGRCLLALPSMKWDVEAR